MAILDFDANGIEPSSGFDPIPAGTYLAHIMESSLNPLKSGNGTGLKLVFQILDGAYKERRIYENLNIQHTTVDTQKIAQQQLAAICRAVNVMHVKESSELHFKPLKIKVSIKPAQGIYEASNGIKGYEAAGGGSMQSSAPTAPSKPANSPPWAK